MNELRGSSSCYQFCWYLVASITIFISSSVLLKGDSSGSRLIIKQDVVYSKLIWSRILLGITLSIYWISIFFLNIFATGLHLLAFRNDLLFFSIILEFYPKHRKRAKKINPSIPIRIHNLSYRNYLSTIMYGQSLTLILFYQRNINITVEYKLDLSLERLSTHLVIVLFEPSDFILTGWIVCTN